MSNKYNTAYFENDEQLYKERQDYLYKDPQDQRDSLFIALNINDLFFKPLGAEITSILETNKDVDIPSVHNNTTFFIYNPPKLIPFFSYTMYFYFR